MNSNSGQVNTDSGKMNSDSDHGAKSWYFPSEYAFTRNQKLRSRSARMSVHDRPEYANASDSDIRSAYQGVKDVFNNKSLTQRQKTAQWSGSAMVLSDAEIGSLAVKHINSDRTSLRGLYAGFDSFPENTKVALHDMAYNMGISRLRNNFPRFNDAINRRDWAAAAAESHRTGIGDNRNNATRDQLLNAR